MSLQGLEVTARISGHAAKNITIMLYTILKDQEKTKGKTRLVNMLKSEKPLKVYTVMENDLKEFTKEAKRYGVLYCALRDKNKSPDKMVDIMVRAEDAPKINRIVERFNYGVIDTASVIKDIEKSKSDKPMDTPSKDIPEVSIDDKLLDDLNIKPTKKEQNAPENPQVAKMGRSHPSEPSSKTKKSGERITTKSERKPVRQEIKEIEKSREDPKSQKRDDRMIEDISLMSNTNRKEKKKVR